jgi:hypothetical protein
LAQNQAVTGDWKLSPYFLYRQTTGQMPVFFVQGRDPSHEVQARYAATRKPVSLDVVFYDRRGTWAGIVSAETIRAPELLELLYRLRGLYALRWEPTVLLAAATLVLGLSLESFDVTHYAAPGFGFVMLAIMAGFGSLRQWRPWDYSYGLSLSRVLPFALVLGLIVPLADLSAVAVHASVRAPCCWVRILSLHTAVENEVDRYEGKNLVIVDTSAKSRSGVYLVSNDPDIDDEKTIWINDDAEFNPLEMDRYPGRRIWRLGWLDGGAAACLQLFQTVSSLADALPDTGRLSGDETEGWVLGSSERCPKGLITRRFDLE